MNKNENNMVDIYKEYPFGCSDTNKRRMFMKVIKRDGREVSFDKDKVVVAIDKAMRGTGGDIDRELSNKIATEVEQQAMKHEHMNIDEIQNLVERKLMQSSRKDVARSYIEYRHWRDQQREQFGFDEFITDVIDLNNLENENANMDENVFTAKKERIVSEILKNHATKYLLTPDVRRAWENNIIYIHDFDSYSIGMHNCLLVDLEDILRDGFITQNGDVRPPRSISSAMQLTAVALQCISNEQFGGVSVANLDYDLAPYVDMSFKKIFERNLKNMNFSDYDTIKTSLSDIRIGDSHLKNNPDIRIKNVYNNSMAEIEKLTLQSAEGLIHNLNTLQSRSGNQLPFTSINYGTDTSPEGRLISKSIMRARMEGVGKDGVTPIFPK